MQSTVCTPVLRLGGELKFQNFGRGQFQGVSYKGGEGVFFLGRDQFILDSFPILKHVFKTSKIFACITLIFNIHIFRFKMDTGSQVDILNLKLNPNFLVQKGVSFHPSLGPQNH